MENNTAGNKPGAQNSGAQEPRCRDWCAEKHAWREERRAWHWEHREALRPFRHMFSGLVLILLGVLFLLDQQGILTGSQWWQWFLVGLGGIFVINSIVYYRSPFRWRAYGKLIAGIILITIGVLFLAGASHWWPIALLVAGACFIGRFIWHTGHAGNKAS
jgi:hypothetical protein